jgi:YgiT-type zinc finger domain-containing protein
MTRRVIQETHTYKGHSITIDQPGEFCNLCGEGILNGDDLNSTSEIIVEFQRVVDESNQL